MTTSLDITPAAGPGKAAIISTRIADTIVSLSSFKGGGSALVTIDLAPTPIVLHTHAPRI